MTPTSVIPAKAGIQFRPQGGLRISSPLRRGLREKSPIQVLSSRLSSSSDAIAPDPPGPKPYRVVPGLSRTSSHRGIEHFVLKVYDVLQSWANGSLTQPLRRVPCRIEFALGQYGLPCLLLDTGVYALGRLAIRERQQRTNHLKIDEADHPILVAETLDTRIPVCHKDLGPTIFPKVVKDAGVVPDGRDAFQILDGAVEASLQVAKCRRVVLLNIRQEPV